ncbi:hypothetical protein BN438_3117 [Erwinia amylovora UPN527]|nr:hypothetical protein BN434_3106 [Erwinia amylovora CFBP 2585]CCP00379.1 hypothetical protein BN438_3117 [Erwinia amylovora UPN527]
MVPTYLSGPLPANVRALLPGFVCQPENLLLQGMPSCKPALLKRTVITTGWRWPALPQR